MSLRRAALFVAAVACLTPCEASPKDELAKILGWKRAAPSAHKALRRDLQVRHAAGPPK